MAEERATSEAEEMFQPIEEFFCAYANNVQIHQTVFDLKLIFGEMVQTPGIPGKIGYVEQHSSITMSWIQAKLLLYFLGLNIEAFESQHGKIKIPPEVMPPEVTPPSEENKNDPKHQAMYELLKNFRERFISNL